MFAHKNRLMREKNIDNSNLDGLQEYYTFHYVLISLAV